MDAILKLLMDPVVFTGLMLVLVIPTVVTLVLPFLGKGVSTKTRRFVVLITQTGIFVLVIATVPSIFSSVLKGQVG